MNDDKDEKLKSKIKTKFTIEELREKVSKEDEENITNLYINGASRDQIWAVVRINKNVIQSYIDWLNTSNEVIETREEYKKQLKRQKREDLQYEEFRDLYLQGASLDFIRNKFHTSKEYIEELKHMIPKSEIHLHNENLEAFGEKYNKTISKEIANKFNIELAKSDIFGKYIGERRHDVYCRIDFINLHSLKKYETEGEMHFTYIITKAIESKGDMQTFIDIYYKYYDDIDWLSPPFCKDFRNGNTMSIAELATKMGVDIE